MTVVKQFSVTGTMVSLDRKSSLRSSCNPTFICNVNVVLVPSIQVNISTIPRIINSYRLVQLIELVISDYLFSERFRMRSIYGEYRQEPRDLTFKQMG